MIDDHPFAYTFEDFVNNANAVIEIIEEDDIPVMKIATDKVQSFVCSSPFCTYLSLYFDGFCIIIRNQKEPS